MRKTENLELNLPEPDDFFDVSHQNENFETIDEELNNKAEKDGSNATGDWNINVSTATKLKTARTIQTDLSSTSSKTFDGSGNVTPGVKGILPANNGGTGKTNLEDSANALINSLTEIDPQTTFTEYTPVDKGKPMSDDKICLDQF